MTGHKIVHLITGLNTGGAEMMLYKLISKMDRDKFEIQVISLTNIGSIGKKIAALGIPVSMLGMRKGPSDLMAIFKFARWLLMTKPGIIQTWMYHADLIGGMAAKMAGGIPVVWGIRHSNLDPAGNKKTTIWTAGLCAMFSKWIPKKIVCCSEASREVHTKLGYDSSKMLVIPNGFDLKIFKPDASARLSVRKELDLPQDTLLIGLVSRFDPQKDHYNFIQAAAKLLKQHPAIHFLLCGDKVAWDNKDLLNWIDTAGIRSNFHLLDRRQDIPHITAALDIASSSSSFGEGFPNVVGEAMACGVPCVVTDVGDSALIVGAAGKVVAPRDSSALAMAWQALIVLDEDGRRRLGDLARQRINERFSLPIITQRYETLYKKMMDRCAE